MRRGEPMLRAVERLLMAIATIALGWYVGIEIAAAVDRHADVRAFEQLVVAAAATAPVPRPPIGPVRVERSEKRATPPRGVIGRIEIPRVGVDAIVREGTDARTLRRAVGHIENTALPGGPGNAVLAGHRDSFFRPLKHVRRGDRIQITTPDGTSTYVVRETRVVPETDLSVLDPTSTDTLTLVTCYPFNFIGSAPERFIVRAVRQPVLPTAN